MLKVFSSTRMELLAAQLAMRLRKDPISDPMARDVVMIPNRGMERWLSMQIAECIGVKANIEFVFPANIVNMVTSAVLQDVQLDQWDPDILVWTLLAVLPQNLDRQEFRSLRQYLKLARATNQDVVTRREYTLIRRVADLLDQYANFRPDWVAKWSFNGSSLDVPPEDAWQPILWQKAQQHLGSVHPFARLDELDKALSDKKRIIEGLPPRLSLFGVSSLPPAFIKALTALSNRIEVTVYAFSAVKGYFGFVPTAREKAAIRHDGLLEEDLHLEGHPLVASLGKTGRDFNEMLASSEAIEIEELCEDTTERRTLLQILQSDIQELTITPGPLNPDASLQFHACHGPLRQVEVLRDVLLRLFCEIKDLRPRDVVVMCPDIDSYAPLIEAVFSDGDDPYHVSKQDAGFPRLPFVVADRNPRNLNPAAEAVIRLLTLAKLRLPASEVLDLLSLPPIHQKFGLSEDSVSMARKWVVESGARWGVDETHRQHEGQPSDRQNTWRFALNRLLLGVATDEVTNGILPCPVFSRDLGGFVRFCETLFSLHQKIIGSPHRTIAAWCRLVNELLDDFIEVRPEDIWQLRIIRDAMETILEESSCCNREVDLDTFLILLDHKIAMPGSTAGLLRGGINFCSLVPMRTIPFRVVCLMGMDYGAFPRQTTRPGFDLMARSKGRIGDRTPRDDDRYLFLEALLSARDAFVVIWSGRDIRDNVELPPAVPVSEMLDVVARMVAGPDGDFEECRKNLVQFHPLQAFSPDAFRIDKPQIQSFDQRNLRAAKALQSEKGEKWCFFDKLPLPEYRADVVNLEDFVRFFEHPARSLLNRRFGIYLDEGGVSVEDREPIELDALEIYKIGSELLHAMIRGDNKEIIKEKFRYSGRLPLGTGGIITLEQIENEAQVIYKSAKELDLGDMHNFHPIELQVGSTPHRLVGVLHGLYERGQLIASFSQIKAKHILSAWIRHLVACATIQDFSGLTYLIGREQTILFRDVPGDKANHAERALNALNTFSNLYHQGMQQPLLLLPDSSYEFIRASNDAYRKAMAVFCSSHQGGKREQDDPYWQFVLGNLIPWDPIAISNIPQELRPDTLATLVWPMVLEAMEAR